MRLVLEKPINFTRNPRGNNTTILKKIENPNTLKIKNKKRLSFPVKLYCYLSVPENISKIT